MGAGGLATAAGVPTMAGNAVIGMGSAGLIGGTASVIGGGNFVSGGVTAAPGGLVGGAASSVASSLLARAGFSGLLGAITSDGIGGAAAAAVDSRLKGNTLGQTLTASFYGFVTGGTLRAGLHYAGPLVKHWWSNWTPKTTPGASTAKTHVSQGIYEFPDQIVSGTPPYVGQSGNIPERLAKHQADGRLVPGTETTAEVLGGKTSREIAEHNRIQVLTGGQKAKNSPKVSNQRDPIGPKRRAKLGIPEPED